MPVKWPALQSLAQTRTGFQLDDAAHALAMTSNTVNSFSQQALQVTSKGYLRCLTRHLPTLHPSKVGSAQLEAVFDMMLMSQRSHLPWLPAQHSAAFMPEPEMPWCNIRSMEGSCEDE